MYVRRHRRRERDAKRGRPVRPLALKHFLYRPGMMDLIDPRVIRGKPIMPNSRVRVIRSRFDPAGKLVWIEDEHGNQQSVWLASLWRTED